MRPAASRNWLITGTQFWLDLFVPLSHFNSWSMVHNTISLSLHSIPTIWWMAQYFQKRATNYYLAQNTHSHLWPLMALVVSSSEGEMISSYCHINTFWPLSVLVLISSFRDGTVDVYDNHLKKRFTKMWMKLALLPFPHHSQLAMNFFVLTSGFLQCHITTTAILTWPSHLIWPSHLWPSPESPLVALVFSFSFE